MDPTTKTIVTTIIGALAPMVSNDGGIGGKRSERSERSESLPA
ncbi:MAG: hypothetical protein ABI556_14960 [Gemmatimonadales bacterium]